MADLSESRALEYAEAVVSGEIVACRWVQRACERHLRDLEEAEDPARGIFWDQESADTAVLVISWLRLFKGRGAGKPFELLPFQAFIVESIFGWKRNRDGFRRFRTGYVELARKNAKTHLSAAIGVVLAFFDGEEGAEVYSGATREKQAFETVRIAKELVRRSPELKGRFEVAAKAITDHSTASFMQAVSAEYGKLDGLDCHGVLIDELHRHPNRGVMDTLEEGSAAREQPFTFIITTAGKGDEQTPYHEERDFCTGMLRGDFGYGPDAAGDDTFAFIACLDTADDWPDLDGEKGQSPDDWKNESTWAKANPALGVMVSQDYLARKVKKAIQTPGLQPTLRRKHFNERIGASRRWLPFGAWDNCKGTAPPDLEKINCWGAIDLSSTQDLTGWLLVFDTEPLWVIPRCWIPEESLETRSRRERELFELWHDQGFLETTPGNVIDYHVIRSAIAEDAKRYNVQEIAFDPRLATESAQKLQDEHGLTMVPFGQNFGAMSEAVLRTEREVIGKNLAHSGHPVLSFCVGNVVPEENGEGLRKLSRRKSRSRIDLAVCLVMAIGRWMLHKAQETSIYESRGIRTV